MGKKHRGSGTKEVELAITSYGSAWIIPGCTVVYSDGAGDHVCNRAAIAFGITISNNKLRIEFFCEDHWR